MDTLKHTIGDTFELAGLLTDPNDLDADGNENPKNITDWTFELTARLARKSADDDTVEFTFTMVDAVNGLFVFTQTPEQLAAWKNRSEYYAKVRYIKPDGFTKTTSRFIIKTQDDN